jgi:hypothetical protein
MSNYFPVVPIETDTEIPEGLGTKEKFWITYGAELRLLKFGRTGTGEDWAEKVACELCSLLEIPHAHYDLASFRGRRCVLSPSIIEADGRLILGNEVINRISRAENGARSYQQKEHTVSRVLAALALFTKDRTASWHQFLGYLLLDAWIGNTDRHQENWGLINGKDRVVRLAPTFDHASSLGRELNDDTRNRRLATRDNRYSVEAFSERARSALYSDQNDEKPLSPIAAFMLAARAQRKSALHWMGRLELTSADQVTAIFDRVPPEFISEPSRHFAEELLKINRARLISFRKQEL